MREFWEGLDGVLFGAGLPLLLLGAGLAYMIALRAFVYAHPLRTLRLGFSGNKKSALRALSVALGGTLGVGNITGVALALAAGGAGALFWMWVSAAVAVFLKYAEIVLALLTRRRGADGTYEGGAMQYLRGKGGRLGSAAAFVFALLCLLCALSLGAPVQSNAAAGALKEALGVPPLVTGLVLLVLAALAVFGGIGRIARFTERLIPFMSGIYLLLCLWAILPRVDLLPSVLGRVVRDAFAFAPCAAGVGGFFASRALRYGVTRGLLSHEAGAGTAAMAHAVAENTPTAQGVMGVIEVLIDTFVFCTATALVLLIAFPAGFPAGSGMGLLALAFDGLVGGLSTPVLALSLFLFAYATVLAWCYYGRRAVGYLTGGAFWERAYLYLYVFLVGLGAILEEGALWAVTDAVVSSLTMLHSASLIPLLPTVVRESRRAGLLGKEGVRAGDGKPVQNEKGGKIVGNGGGDGHALPACGVGKGEAHGVEHGTRHVVTLLSIQAVTEDGKAHM